MATRRARVILDRGARESSDPHTRALAESLTRPAPRDAVVAQWCDDVAHRRTSLSPEMIDALAAAFSALYRPTGMGPANPPDSVKRTIIDQFHLLYYHQRPRVWQRTFYREIPILKLTSDLWIYSQLLERLRPGLVIETGTRFGGSSYWMADQMRLLGTGRIVTIDIDPMPERVPHPDVTYLLGSSSDPDVRRTVEEMLPADGSPVMVILDSDHSRDHVLAEMRLWADLVTPGSYLIVEDTNINGHPVYADFGPGPYEAVEEFLADDDRFEVDLECEMYYVTQNPRGYLRRR
jgi:cephalosporin hydroxylase